MMINGFEMMIDAVVVSTFCLTAVFFVCVVHKNSVRNWMYSLVTLGAVLNSIVITMTFYLQEGQYVLLLSLLLILSLVYFGSTTLAVIMRYQMGNT